MPTIKEINSLRFDCVETITEQEIIDRKYAAVDKLKVNRNGKLVIADPEWLAYSGDLAQLMFNDSAAYNRVKILATKTQRAYSSDYHRSHSLTTLSSIYSLLMSVPVKTKVAPHLVSVIRELSILTSAVGLKQKGEAEALRTGNVTFVSAE